MIHREEYYTCDRCGTVINPKFSIPFVSIRRQVFDIHTNAPEIQGYMDGEIKQIPDEKSVMTIMEYHTYNSKSYHLCYKCRKDFERFMRNGQAAT